MKKTMSADAHPSILLESLNQKGYSIKHPLECNYVILSHYASKENNNTPLFNLIKCENILSAAMEIISTAYLIKKF